METVIVPNFELSVSLETLMIPSISVSVCPKTLYTEFTLPVSLKRLYVVFVLISKL